MLSTEQRDRILELAARGILAMNLCSSCSLSMLRVIQKLIEDKEASKHISNLIRIKRKR